MNNLAIPFEKFTVDFLKPSCFFFHNNRKIFLYVMYLPNYHYILWSILWAYEKYAIQFPWNPLPWILYFLFKFNIILWAKWMAARQLR